MNLIDILFRVWLCFFISLYMQFFMKEIMNLVEFSLAGLLLFFAIWAFYLLFIIFIGDK